jgi:hypothetical protein
VRSNASSFIQDYPLLCVRSSGSFLRFLPRLPFISIPPFIFPSITCPRRQFLRKIWLIQLTFRLLISSSRFLYPLTLPYTSQFLTWSVQLIFSIFLQLMWNQMASGSSYYNPELCKFFYPADYCIFAWDAKSIDHAVTRYINIPLVRISLPCALPPVHTAFAASRHRIVFWQRTDLHFTSTHPTCQLLRGSIQC